MADWPSEICGWMNGFGNEPRVVCASETRMGDQNLPCLPATTKHVVVRRERSIDAAQIHRGFRVQSLRHAPCPRCRIPGSAGPPAGAKVGRKLFYVGMTFIPARRTETRQGCTGLRHSVYVRRRLRLFHHARITKAGMK